MQRSQPRLRSLVVPAADGSNHAAKRLSPLRGGLTQPITGATVAAENVRAKPWPEGYAHCIVTTKSLLRAGLWTGIAAVGRYGDEPRRHDKGLIYALTFGGLVCVPATGLSVFRAQIDGGCRIEMEGEDALVWEGQHGTTEKAILRHLANSDHTVAVTCLYDQLPARNFRLEWEGPHLPRHNIPLEGLRVADAGRDPVPAVTAAPPGDGTGRVKVKVEARGRQSNRTRLFLGPLQLAKSGGLAVAYTGPLSRGTNTLRCRVVYDDKHLVDSDPVFLDVSRKAVSDGWTVRYARERGKQRLLILWRSSWG